MPPGKRRGRKPQSGFVRKLADMVGKLKAQYDRHHSALKSIETIFKQIGIPIGEDRQEGNEAHLWSRPGRKPGRRAGKRDPGRPPAATANAVGITSGGAPRGRRRKGRRGTFATTAPESILAFVKKAGSKGATGAEITKHWRTEGRGTGEYVVIGKLVKDRKLKKQKIEGGRGSRYTTA